MKIVTAAQMAVLEQASERQGVSTDTLMEQAGLEVAHAARRMMEGAAGVRVLVLVGPGNNGADGLVAARHLRRWGARVTAYVATVRPAFDPKMDLAREYDVEVVGGPEGSDIAQLAELIEGARLVIDAVLGTGRSRPLQGDVRDALLLLKDRRAATGLPKVLALDLPTGLNPDTGEVDSACAGADLTLALGRPKAGLLAFPGGAYTGKLEVAEIGLPSNLEEDAEVDLELITPEWVGRRLPPRPLDSHKGIFGHALVVAGSRNYVGAAALASIAASRVGAGLVTLATPESVYSIAAAKLTEIIHLPLPEDGEGRVHPDAAKVIKANLRRHNALLVGCGLGWSRSTESFMEQLLLDQGPEAATLGPATPYPGTPRLGTIIDADGLNNLAQSTGWWQRLNRATVVTPHPGEMATLTGIPVASLQSDRIGAARQWASQWGAAVALKGAYTVVAEPGGMVRVSPFANPGLASGGTGDVLSGIIVGLMAQGLTPADAACCGVYLHGQAAEDIRQRLGDSGMVASDLIDALPQANRRLRAAAISSAAIH